MSIASKLLNNTAYHALGRVWQLAIGLFMAPFILSYLGDAQFAIWVLFWTLSTYFMFMDFGFAVSLTREAAQLEVREDYGSINQAISSLCLFYVFLGIMVMLLSWQLTPWLLRVMNVPENLTQTAIAIIFWSGSVFALIGIVNTLTSLLRGLQRFDLITKAMIIVSFINIIGVYVALELSYGVKGLLLVTAIVYAFQILLLLIYIKRIMPTFHLRVQDFSSQRLREMLPFGMRIQVSKFAELASYQADKVLLAVFLPLQFVTMYDLGSRIASLMRDLPYALTASVFPAASEMQEKNDYTKLWHLYDRGSKYMLVVTVPMLLGLWLTAHLIIGLWLGHVSHEVYLSVIMLSFAYWLVIALAMSFSIGLGLGWSKPVLYCAIIQAILNISLSCILIQNMGFQGALWGTVIAILIANGILYFWFCRDFDRSLRDEFHRFWRVSKANILPLLGCGALVLYADSYVVWGERLPSLILLLSTMVTYFVLYCFSLKYTRIFDDEDARLLGQKIPAIKWMATTANNREKH